VNKLILATMLALGIVAATAGKLADDAMSFRNPDRLIGGSRINLRPLFTWWTNAVQVNRDSPNAEFGRRVPKEVAMMDAMMAQRPLTSWSQVIGSKVAERASGWIVSATVCSWPGKGQSMKIFLKHPPIPEERQVLALQRERKDLRDRRDQITGGNVHRAELRRVQIEKELLKYPTSLDVAYRIAFFAMKTGEVFEGMEVFEMGLVYGQ
jgi:hypothetical protein